MDSSVLAQVFAAPGRCWFVWPQELSITCSVKRRSGWKHWGAEGLFAVEMQEHLL